MEIQIIDDLMQYLPNNVNIINGYLTAYNKIRDPLYHNIICSISGGSDSDIVLDICENVKDKDNITYVWFDTGLEYEATKKHLQELKEKYNIDILKLKPIKAIPICCKEYGQPFMSKQISEFMSRLQNHNFQWEDESYDTLALKYPKCLSALSWWCNHSNRNDGKNSLFNISQKRWLKEFIICNPPQFKISNKCCTYAKKMVALDVKKRFDCDLSITGLRKAEKGARFSAYKNCFTDNDKIMDEYRPIFWYTDLDKQVYKNHFNIQYSDCYETYGLDRTGCCGCPFGKNWENELDVIKKFEPKLYKLVMNIFGDSYKYMEQYYEFRDKMDQMYGSYSNYLKQNSDQKEIIVWV